MFSPQAARAAAAGPRSRCGSSPATAAGRYVSTGSTVRRASGSARHRGCAHSTPGSGLAHDPAIRILRGEKAKITVVGLVNPKPGVYTIEMLPGSAHRPSSRPARPPTSPRHASRPLSSGSGQGAPWCTPSVARRSASPSWKRRAPAAARSARSTGVAAGSFTSRLGTDRRTIVAEFELAGLPAEHLTVAQFLPPSPRLGRPVHLRIVRRGRALRVSWRAVPGATRYELVERLNIGGEHLVRSGGHKLTLGHVAPYDSGRISVRAMATLRQGKPAMVTLPADGRTPTRLVPLPKPRTSRRHHR